MTDNDQDLTADEIAYLNMFGFEPIIKVKNSPVERSFTVDIYVKLLTWGDSHNE